MKSLLHILAVVILCISFKIKEPKVYVFNTSGSVGYHTDKNCRGLSKCKHEILYITVKAAIYEYNKRACKMYH